MRSLTRMEFIIAKCEVSRQLYEIIPTGPEERTRIRIDHLRNRFAIRKLEAQPKRHARRVVSRAELFVGPFHVADDDYGLSYSSRSRYGFDFYSF
ncbi:hypothetical protein Tcan_02786 [Toxocara canis]|uniref:Uncharacterized protein n=1 Tax=Toxocara canis TaxID=6265 RepID=A0A0B2VBK8_TOXCA|nr:hypothetical protein Tcan_02786 [Toxocara canis]